MTTKRAAVFLIVYALAVSQFGASARATILGVACSYGPGPVPSEHWSFDNDSQVLTLTSPVYDISPVSIVEFPLQWLIVNGQQDTQSTLTIVANITNETGVPFTGYNLYIANPLARHSEFVAGSVQATGSAQVYQHRDGSHELTWSAPIPDEGAFSIQFDVLNSMMDPGGGWKFSLGQSPVPEPVTVALLGLGGLLVLRIRKAH